VAEPTGATTVSPAPVLLRNARLLGSDEPGDVLLVDGLVAEVPSSPASGASHAAKPGTSAEVVDLEGRWLMPGLWDEHVHFTQWTLTSRRLDVSAGDSAAHTAALVGASLRSGDFAGSAGPVIGYGFRDGMWADQPTSRLLDEVAPDVAVVLISADIHCVWLNSKAVSDFGVTVDESGVLREDAAFALQGTLDELPEELIDEWADAAARRAAARGVVGVADLEMSDNAEVWRRRRERGFDALRVRFAVYREHLELAASRGFSTSQRLDERIEVGYLKVLIDGSLNTRTAYMTSPYPGDGHGHGMLTVQPDDLEQLLRRSAEVGLVPTVHAIGDRAVGIALDTFERVGHGGRMEHAQLISAADFPRFAALGVTASVQPEHLLDDRDIAEKHWPGQTERAFALRSLLDAGASIVLGSDAPVAPLDPWVTLAAAVHRQRDEREPWHPEQRITTAEGIVASTDGRGPRIVTGSPADLVAVEADPLTADLETLRSMPVAATLVGGAFTHRAL
jgi:predicted amidohydrolase YtcJ